MDSVPHSDASVIQQFHEAAHYTHIVSPARTAAHLPGTARLLLLRSFMAAAAEINCGISKGTSAGRRCEPIPGHSRTPRAFSQTPGVSGVRPGKKTPNCLFFQIISKLLWADTRGLLVGRMTKVPRARAGSGTKQLKQAQRQALCLSHIDTIIKPRRAQSRQAACVLR